MKSIHCLASTHFQVNSFPRRNLLNFSVIQTNKIIIKKLNKSSKAFKDKKKLFKDSFVNNCCNGSFGCYFYL